jgi:hypothetical protein
MSRSRRRGALPNRALTSSSALGSTLRPFGVLRGFFTMRPLSGSRAARLLDCGQALRDDARMCRALLYLGEPVLLDDFAVPARLGAGAPKLHAEDAAPAQPRGLRHARLGRRLARAREALCVRLGRHPRFRPQPEGPRREDPRRVPARARARRALQHQGRDLHAERAPVPVRRRAARHGAQRRPGAFPRDEAVADSPREARVPGADPRHDGQRVAVRARRIETEGSLREAVRGRAARRRGADARHRARRPGQARHRARLAR